MNDPIKNFMVLLSFKVRPFERVAVSLGAFLIT